MSRNPLYEDLPSSGMKNMDSLTLSALDASRLKIPFGNAGARARASSATAAFSDADQRSELHAIQLKQECRGERQQEAGNHFSVHHNQLSANQHGSLATVPAPPPLAPSVKKDVVIDVRARYEPRQQQGDTQTMLEIPGFVVPGGYSVFAISLCLANMTIPDLSSNVCVALSPVLMICLAIHALGVPVWVSMGLVFCAWFTPAVCAAWRIHYTLCFFVVLGVLMAAGTRRMIASACLFALLMSMPLATQTHWTGLDPRWGLTMGGFFLALECVTASLGSGKIIYRIKHVT